MNVVACFLKQTYDNKHLFIMDDGETFESQTIGDNITLISAEQRFDTLADKFNALAAIAKKSDFAPTLFANWEDDDIYLPDHLLRLSEVANRSPQELFLITPEEVWSNYQTEMGSTVTEKAAGRFHGSWAWSTKLHDKVGGWPSTDKIMFDQLFLSTLKQAGTHLIYEGSPTYVYRWGNPYYHGSVYGDDFTTKVGQLRHLPDYKIPRLMPNMDIETSMIYKKHNELNH